MGKIGGRARVPRDSRLFYCRHRDLTGGNLDLGITSCFSSINGRRHLRGIGLYKSPTSLAEHNDRQLAAGKILLIADVFNQ